MFSTSEDVPNKKTWLIRYFTQEMLRYTKYGKAFIISFIFYKFFDKSRNNHYFQGAGLTNILFIFLFLSISSSCINSNRYKKDLCPSQGGTCALVSF